MVSHSDLLTVLPREVALRYGASFNLRVVETAFAIPPIPLYLTYNKLSLRNPEFRNLLDVLTDTVSWEHGASDGVSRYARLAPRQPVIRTHPVGLFLAERIQLFLIISTWRDK
ncbi:hypothetical protein O0544_00665 [Edwardsiella anguillarum]|nr:hypothetical protein [Edwardsiella anguillarum]